MSCLLWPSLCIDKTRGSEKSYQGCIADGACTCYDYCLPSKHQWCQCINYKVHHYITALLALLSTSFMIHKCRLMMWCALRLECSSAIIWQLDDMIAVKKLCSLHFSMVCAAKVNFYFCGGGEFSDQSFADTHTRTHKSLCRSAATQLHFFELSTVVELENMDESFPMGLAGRMACALERQNRP